MAIDESKLNEFLGRALVDLGGAVNAVLMSIGDELGLYKALAKGPQSPAELARNTNTNERYIREWLNCQAAGGYVTFDKATAINPNLPYAKGARLFARMQLSDWHDWDRESTGGLSYGDSRWRSRRTAARRLLVIARHYPGNAFCPRHHWRHFVY